MRHVAPRTCLRVFGLVCICVMTVLAARQGLTSFAIKQTNDVHKGLTVAPESLNFGRVFETDAIVLNIPVVNKSLKLIHVKGFERSCNCTKVEPEAFRLEPQGRLILRVSIETKPNSATSSNDGSTRHAVIELKPVFETPGLPPAVWKIEGEIISIYSFSPQFVNLKWNAIDEIFPSYDVVAECRQSMKHLEVQSDSSILSASIEEVAGKNNSHVIHLFPKRGAGPGVHKCNIIITGDAEDGERIPGILPVQINVEARMVALPSSLALGARRIGSMVEKTIALQACDRASFHINSVISTNEDVLIQKIQSYKTDISIIHVKVHIKKIGDFQSALAISVSPIEGSKEPTKLTIPVNYHGIQASGEEL